MSATKEVNYSELAEGIGAMMESGEKGTIQYFCERTKNDDEKVVAACISMLENEGRAELLKTDEVHESCGSPIYLGVYGKTRK